MTRVGTFNLLHGMPGAPGAEAGPDLLAAAVRHVDADVLGIQEVDRFQERSGRVDQTAVVADALGAADWRFVPALHGTPGEEWEPAAEDDQIGPGSGDVGDGPTYGVGLVSRLPVRSWHVLRCPPARASLPLLTPDERRRARVTLVADEPRVVLAAVVDGARGPFTVATAHLSFVPGVNVRQLRAARRWLRGLPGPSVLAGDLNLPLTVVRATSGMTPLVRTPTYPSFAARIQLDHVLADGIGRERVSGARGHRLAVSDHHALSVDLDLGV